MGTHAAPHGGHDPHATDHDIYLVGHDGQMHPAHLQHHFVSSQQQFEASKLGMWLFLVTEILLFGGMFVAYAIFRAWYPELYADASLQLDTVMGAVNTLVLLASSLTVAWAIRCAQMDNQTWLFRNLVLTVLLACGFLVVKYFEYSHKFELGILPGANFELMEGTRTVGGDIVQAAGSEEGSGQPAGASEAQGQPTLPSGGTRSTATEEAIVLPPSDPTANLTPAERIAGEGVAGSVEEAVTGEAHAEGAAHAGGEGHGREGPIFSDPRAGIFFSIYYVMTGIHGIHVVIGIIAISILAYKAKKGRYTSVYYTPVENVGLYWHVVDVIWIFLFPLMYLI